MTPVALQWVTLAGALVFVAALPGPRTRPGRLQWAALFVGAAAMAGSLLYILR